jgi:hypothetical protein
VRAASRGRLTRRSVIVLPSQIAQGPSSWSSVRGMPISQNFGSWQTRYQQRMSGWGRALGTGPELRLRRQSISIDEFTKARATSCRTSSMIATIAGADAELRVAQERLVTTAVWAR